ncbi:MAG: sugar phosphate isomerase/epimerase [Opitutaceae bacterium]|nr:sugar phosphate isomerase/epimerase [Opitutaceae bacterium]
MLREIADLGFDHVELSHGIRITLVPGILAAVEEGVIKVGSTHNFCPLPTGVTQAAPNIFEPSALDSQEHDQWLRHTKRSIDFAAQLRARALVCHLGSVRFLWFSPADTLRNYPHSHPQAVLAGDPAYQALLAKALGKLRKRMGPFWAKTKASVHAILEHAAQKGVKLGCENREKFEELPLDEDFPAFLEGLPFGAPVGYWHDTGHADIKEKMGLLDQRQHLEKMAPRLIGFHLHDVSAAGQDHQPVGAGQVDFKMISGFWRPEHLLVLEFSPRLAVEEVMVSKQRIEALLG